MLCAASWSVAISRPCLILPYFAGCSPIVQVSEAVLAKTKELREAEAALSRMKKELGEDRGQQRQGQQRGDTEGQRGDSAQHASGGTLLGPYDTEVAAAAARVAAARAALQQLQKAASLLQPESMVKQVRATWAMRDEKLRGFWHSWWSRSLASCTVWA